MIKLLTEASANRLSVSGHYYYEADVFTEATTGSNNGIGNFSSPELYYKYILFVIQKIIYHMSYVMLLVVLFLVMDYLFNWLDFTQPSQFS